MNQIKNTSISIDKHGPFMTQKEVMLASWLPPPGASQLLHLVPASQIYLGTQ